jgi:hypothetical protein
VSYASTKGYTAEHAVVGWYLSHGLYVSRPRTTSHSDTDCGDITGVPWVTSVKNHARIKLADAVDEMSEMVRRSEWETGFVVHKRLRKGKPGDWYVTLTLDLMDPFIHSYLATTKTQRDMRR